MANSVMASFKKRIGSAFVSDASSRTLSYRSEISLDESSADESVGSLGDFDYGNDEEKAGGVEDLAVLNVHCNDLLGTLEGMGVVNDDPDEAPKWRSRRKMEPVSATGLESFKAHHRSTRTSAISARISTRSTFRSITGSDHSFASMASRNYNSGNLLRMTSAAEHFLHAAFTNDPVREASVRRSLEELRSIDRIRVARALREEQILELLQAFNEFDSNGNGFLEFDEFRTLVSSLCSLSASDQLHAFEVADRNQDSHLTFGEFVVFIVTHLEHLGQEEDDSLDPLADLAVRHMQSIASGDRHQVRFNWVAFFVSVASGVLGLPIVVGAAFVRNVLRRSWWWLDAYLDLIPRLSARPVAWVQGSAQILLLLEWVAICGCFAFAAGIPSVHTGDAARAYVMSWVALGMMRGFNTTPTLAELPDGAGGWSHPKIVDHHIYVMSPAAGRRSAPNNQHHGRRRHWCWRLLCGCGCCRCRPKWSSTSSQFKVKRAHHVRSMRRRRSSILRKNNLLHTVVEEAATRHGTEASEDDDVDGGDDVGASTRSSLRVNSAGSAGSSTEKKPKLKHLQRSVHRMIKKARVAADRDERLAGEHAPREKIAVGDFCRLNAEEQRMRDALAFVLADTAIPGFDTAKDVFDDLLRRSNQDSIRSAGCWESRNFRRSVAFSAALVRTLIPVAAVGIFRVASPSASLTSGDAIGNDTQGGIYAAQTGRGWEAALLSELGSRPAVGWGGGSDRSDWGAANSRSESSGERALAFSLLASAVSLCCVAHIIYALLVLRSAYVRSVARLEIFTALSSPKESLRKGVAYLNLQLWRNIVCWYNLRVYLIQVYNKPMDRVFEGAVGFVSIVGIFALGALWFSNPDHSTPSSVHHKEEDVAFTARLVYDATLVMVIFCHFTVAAVWRSDIEETHEHMLLDEIWKLQVKLRCSHTTKVFVPKRRDERAAVAAGVARRLEAAKSSLALLQQVRTAVRVCESSPCVLGVTLNRNWANAIVLFMVSTVAGMVSERFVSGGDS